MIRTGRLLDGESISCRHCQHPRLSVALIRIQLRKALGTINIKYISILDSRLLNLIPVRDLRPYRFSQIHSSRLHSSATDTNLGCISSLPRSNISIPHPPLPPLPWTRHTPLQRHGQNIPRITNMYGNHGRRSQRSLRRPARLLRLQVSLGQRHLRQNLPQNRHRPQTISKKDWGPRSNFQTFGHAVTGSPSKKEQNRASAIRPSRRALSSYQDRSTQPASRHRAAHATGPSD